MSAERDLGPVVRAAQAGERAAQRDVLERLAEKLLPFALALCRDPREADEVLVDTLSRAYERLGQLKDPQAVLAWARRILVRRFIDGRRRWRIGHVQLETAPSVNREPIDLEHVALHTAIARLDRKEQALLAMHYWVGMSLAECAEALEVPQGTVKSRLWSIRSKLREDLGGTHG